MKLPPKIFFYNKKLHNNYNIIMVIRIILVYITNIISKYFYILHLNLSIYFIFKH